MTLSRLILAVLLLDIAAMVHQVDQHVSDVAQLVARQPPPPPAPALPAATVAPVSKAPPARIGRPRTAPVRHVARHPPTIIDNLCNRR